MLPEEAKVGYELTRAGHKMSNERVRITGLAPGRYQLRINDEVVGRLCKSGLEIFEGYR